MRSIQLDNIRSQLSDMVVHSLSAPVHYERIDPDIYASLLAQGYYDNSWDDWVDYRDYHDDFDGYDDYGNDDSSLLYPPGVVTSKKGKGKGKGKGKSTGKNGLKVIWFYPDYHCEDDRMEFNGLLEFSEFCKDEGYQLPLSIYTELDKCGSLHCCLDPFMRSVGRMHITHARSYGEMFYEVCDAEELP